jgi:long-chain acyl-CoA synthetase
MKHPWDRRLGVWWIAQDRPETMAVLDSPSGPLTYGELTGRAHQIVHGLRGAGVETGQPVAVMLGNGVDIIEVSMACNEAGWYFLPLNSYLTAGELHAILTDSGAAALIIDHRYGAVLDDAVLTTAAAARCFTVGDVAGLPTLDSLRATQPTTAPPDRRTGAMFTYTSGTTGKPKGIRRKIPDGDPSQSANDAALFGRAFDFKPFEGPFLVCTGMYHGGSHSYYMGALNVGHGLVIMDKFDPEQALALIERHQVRTSYMVPTQFHRLMRLPAEVRERYDVSSLHAVVHSAAPCPRELKEQMMAWWGPVIWETYGGMEGAATIAKPARWLEKPGTVGRAIAGVELKIFDDDGNELPTGEIGNIYYRTVDRFMYHRDDEGTSKAFRGDYFSIGDVGYLDADGYLFIRDRVKDMIISGGVNIFPAESEGVLASHPAVADVGVFGIPDPDWGEQVKAVVMLAPGFEPTSAMADELIEYCKSKLAVYKCPRSVDFRDELPRTEAGKLYKRKLRDQYWAQQERQV